MRMNSRVASVALLSLSLGACAVGEKLGWHKNRVAPTDEIRATCETAVRSIRGQPDHPTAMRACVDAKVHRGDG